MENKKVIVTGGAGFIGRCIIEACKQIGWNSVSLDISSSPSKSGYFTGSVQDYDFVKKLTRDVDLIFHEAAITSPPEFESSGKESFQTNVIGTLNVLKAAEENGVKRVVLASSSSVYGNIMAPGKEDMILPIYNNLYPLSKSVDEQLAAFFSSRGEVETVCLRYFNTFGIGENSKGAYSSVISKFIHDIRANRIPMIYGDGSQRRDFIYIEDVVKANMLAAEKGVSGESYNVGTGTSTQFTDILEIVKDEMNSDVEPYFEPIPYDGYQMFTQADLTKSRSQLGFKPSYDIRKGVRKMIDSIMG